MSVFGDTAVIGASGDDVCTGAAYVFTRDAGGSWSEQTKLIASDWEAPDQFGFSVSLNADTAVIGAFGNDDAGFSSGSAYVFTRVAGGTWSEQAKLTAADAAAGDHFGDSVAIDHSRLVIGASGASAFAGAAYVFTKASGGTWTQQKLTAFDGAPDDRYGYSVAISGGTCLVGAPENDGGSAYLYLLVEAEIFADGFETGTTSVWSSTAGGS